MQIFQRVSSSVHLARSAHEAGGSGTSGGARTRRTPGADSTSRPPGSSASAAQAAGQDDAHADGTGKGGDRGDSFALLTGAAAGCGAVGAALALADVTSPLRAPFTLFFLLAAPAAGLATVLRRLDALSRTVVALIGAAALDLLVAEVMLALHMWSVRGGVVAVTALSAVLLLPLALGRSGGARQGG
jgi:hypothetical protein